MRKYKIIAGLINLMSLILILTIVAFLISLNSHRRYQLQYVDIIAIIFFCSIIYLLKMFIFKILIKKSVPISLVASITAITGVMFTYYFVNSFGITRINFTNPDMLKRLITILIIGFILPYSERFFQGLLKDKYFKQ